MKHSGFAVCSLVLALGSWKEWQGSTPSMFHQHKSMSRPFYCEKASGMHSILYRSCLHRPSSESLTFNSYTHEHAWLNSWLKLHVLNSSTQLLFYLDWTIAKRSWKPFQHYLSNPCVWSRMQQREWSLMSRRGRTSHFSS